MIFFQVILWPRHPYFHETCCYALAPARAVTVLTCTHALHPELRSDSCSCSDNSEKTESWYIDGVSLTAAAVLLSSLLQQYIPCFLLEMHVVVSLGVFFVKLIFYKK